MHYTEAADTLAGLFPATKAKFRACYRKCAYPDLGQALAVKEKRERQTGMTLFIYRCDFAEEPDGHFHLSRQEPSLAQMRAKYKEFCEAIQQADEELRRLESDIITIRRQCAALKSAMRQRCRRIERARSVALLTTLYRQQREDVAKAIALADEELDLILGHKSLLYSLQQVIMPAAQRTAESYRAYVSQLMVFERETERTREENAAFLAEAMAGLDAQEQKDIAWTGSRSINAMLYRRSAGGRRDSSAPDDGVWNAQQGQLENRGGQRCRGVRLPRSSR